ncbi:P-loop containing nucleoside triphosphate hydrolase superfamily protein [Abeliophyllum distichum]|uniref:P-loop containing nucleoside triphosphate hydrolase superfamily protein n=1 Tax=Abeliophyllum distichum TaxID=126358 RepID=A0ABD1V7H1_9LAMI
MQSFGDMQSMTSNIFSAYASVAASMMLFRSMAHDIIPEPIKSYIVSAFTRIFSYFFTPLSTHITMVVDENSGMTRNQIYESAEIYLHTKINPNTGRVKVSKNPKKKNISLSMEKNELVIDSFSSIELKWQFVLEVPENQKDHFQPEKRYFELSFNKLYRETVLNEYLPFVMKKAKEIKEKDRNVKLYTRDCPYSYSDDDEDGGNGSGVWGCVNLDHPVTFEKLAMDPEMKKQIIEDLDRFVRRKEYYKKVGKAWKRGYFLYGPPGTGKSSLIAAMANYLKFDIYDLELTSLYSNSELKRTLLSTTNRSIIVIEDIDCSAPMLNREVEPEPSDTKLTLSGLLNFMDGLWSNCGDERIIIFTTNHKEKIDPALLRPGRMDMHIHMSYCTPAGFDVLALNYLAIHDHPKLFPDIKGLMQEVKVTPAEIAEHLMRNENAELALEGVVDLLKRKKAEKSPVQETNAGTEVQEEAKKEAKFEKIVKSLKSFRKKSSRGKSKRV